MSGSKSGEMKGRAGRWLGLAALSALALAVPGMPAWAQSTAVSMPVMALSAGMYRITAEVAHTPANRQVGLMHRRSMETGHGMIFAYPQDARHCMWMRNTLIPLSVAFLDGEGRILNVEDMTPETDDSHCAVAPARFALEMNQGWFSERGILPGHTLRGLDRLPAAR